MKKALLLLTLMFSFSGFVSAQSTATNFTATDCNGGVHTLFDELDSGQIIVLVWVMPCIGCVSDAVAARDAVQSFAASHPGKVSMYMADDDGGTSCGMLTAWSASNGIGGLMDGNIVFFENTGNVMDQAHYGGMGMPHVVVMGGADHKIYYNKLNGSDDGIAIRNAISQALGIPTSIKDTRRTVEGLTVSLSPEGSTVRLNYDLNSAGKVNIDILNANGAVVQTASTHQQRGMQQFAMPLTTPLASGYYIVRISLNGSTSTCGFATGR